MNPTKERPMTQPSQPVCTHRPDGTVSLVSLGHIRKAVGLLINILGAGVLMAHLV